MAERDALKVELATARKLLLEASNLLWHHHESGYNPTLGQSCPICLPPNSDPFNTIFTRIFEFAKKHSALNNPPLD